MFACEFQVFKCFHCLKDSQQHLGLLLFIIGFGTQCIERLDHELDYLRIFINHSVSKEGFALILHRELRVLVLEPRAVTCCCAISKTRLDTEQLVIFGAAVDLAVTFSLHSLVPLQICRCSRLWILHHHELLTEGLASSL